MKKSYELLHFSKTKKSIIFLTDFDSHIYRKALINSLRDKELWLIQLKKHLPKLFFGLIFNLFCSFIVSFILILLFIDITLEDLYILLTSSAFISIAIILLLIVLPIKFILSKPLDFFKPFDRKIKLSVLRDVGIAVDKYDLDTLHISSKNKFSQKH